MAKPTIITTAKTLPFDELSPSEFERLCLWLVEREGFKNAQHLGESGNEQGRDVVAHRVTEAGEELWYFQCKRHKRITSSVLKAEVDKYNQLAASDPAKRPTAVVFVTSAAVSGQVREDVGAYCRDGGYDCTFWARTELDMRVKKYPDLVAEFFRAGQAHAVPALHQIPPPPSDFTGRSAEVERLVSAVERGATSIVGLYGMGGAGKTALALKLAEHLAPLYPDAQIHINLKGSGHEPLPAVEAMLHVVRSYHPSVEPSKSEAEVAGWYRSVMYGQRGILFLDDAADRDQVEPLLPSDEWLLIVTSRRRFHLPGLTIVPVGPLSREDARSMLSAIAPHTGEQAGVIAHLCGELPLALRLAGSALAEREDLSPEDYARMLSNAGRRLTLVQATIGLSYELLTEAGRELWRRLAIFPSDFQPEGAAQVMGLGLEAELARDVLGEFVRNSLAEWDPVKGRYRLHDLLRLFAWERLSDEERRESRLRFANYYGAILAEANSLFPLGGAAAVRALSTLDAEWDNIRSAHAWAEENMDADDEAAAMCNAFPNAGAYLLDLRQKPLERIRWLETALAASRRLNARDAEGAHLTNLGIAHTSAGNPRRAVELLDQALAIHRELGDRKGEGQVLGSLGSAYAALGDNRRAAELYEQDLIIVREFGDRRAEGAVLHNLASVCAALGETGRAAGLYEEALVIMREERYRYGEGSALGSLGLLYADQGDNLLAMRLHEQALEISRELGDMRGEGHNLGNLGVALFNLGAFENALQCHRRQLDIARETGDLRGEAFSLSGLASVYTATGEGRLAGECFRQAIKLTRDIEDHFMEGKILGNWGNLLLKDGEARRALELYEQQLSIARETGDRRGEAAALWNIGWASKLGGDVARAVEYGETALRVYEEIQDPNNVARARKHLAVWRESQ